MQAMKISLSALDVEWQRLQVIATNLANMNTTQSSSGVGFRPMNLISGSNQSFAQMMATRTSPTPATGVKVLGLEPQPTGLTRSYEPSNPDADANGFVTRVNVNHAHEMTALIKTSRVYEANLTAVTIAQQMYNRALEIGRQT